MHLLHRAARFALCCTLAVVVAACQKNQARTSTDATGADVTAQNPAQGLQVSHIDLGKHVGDDNVVTDRADTFLPNETIYASVFTSGAAPATELKTRFTFQDGQVIDETSRTIAPQGAAVTEFHISKPDGFPVGKYRVDVFVNGAPAGTKEFEIKST